MGICFVISNHGNMLKRIAVPLVLSFMGIKKSAGYITDA